ncbi:MAG: type II secretion system F family protein [Candidatus Doudnabacteria bacterium]|nr:type II secretion system F family protein [bacterium]MDZ4243747.1 type II secretion system F family protein [Candidatus Doudnabacteria bacterium]
MSPISFLKNFLGHVSLLEKLTFINNLAVTIRAGLPVSKALNVLTKQMPNHYFRKIIGEIAHNVEEGKTLSESMAPYKNVFTPIVVNMVKVGEESGELDKTLEYLGKQVARDYNLIRRTRSALIYPAVVGVALVVIGYIMFAFVLPKLTATFKAFDTDLPFLTVTIIKIVDIVSHYSILILVMAVGAVFAFLYWRKTSNGRIILHRIVFAIPIVRILVKKINMARFTIIFSGLMRSGMPIVEALRITANTMTNLYYQRALSDVSEKVKVGVDLVVALEKYPKLFTPMVTEMIQVGEESGTMEKVLGEVANFYEADIDDTMKNLSSIVEPVLVMVIGAVVGVLAVGLILPIYSIGQNI